MNKCYICQFYLWIEWKSTLSLTLQSYRGSHCFKVSMYHFCHICMCIYTYICICVHTHTVSCEMPSNLLKATQWSGRAGTGMSAPSCISEPWVGTHSHVQDTERRVRITKTKNYYKKKECLEKWLVRSSTVLWKWVLYRTSDGILLWGGFHDFTGLLPPLVPFFPSANFQKKMIVSVELGDMGN